MRRARRALLLVVLLIPSAGWVGVAGRALAGGVIGMAAGTVISTGVLVARARYQNHYLETMGDLLGWQAAGVPVGAIAGVAAGIAGRTVLGGVTLGTVGGGLIGAAAGAAVGAVVSSYGPDRWAGGTMGGAVGMLLGFVLGWLVVHRHISRTVDEAAREGGRPLAVVLAVVLVGVAGAGLLLAAVGGGGPVAGGEVAPVPREVSPAEDVVILVGDPGEGRFHTYPVFPKVSAEVDAWAREIGRDSAVTVVVLGDMIYPDGMHEPGSPRFERDSARVADQVRMVTSPVALDHSVRMYFVAGNHDWGMREDHEGARRLRNLGAFLDRSRDRGANVDLTPAAGSGVPRVEDIGDRLRLILLDTAWWLLDAEPGRKDAMVEGVADALAGAGDRRVVIASHHPFESAGPHGGIFDVWETMGLRRLLYKSGALLQDLHSRPYWDLRRRLSEVFVEAGRPLAWAGGHEHSLQVMVHDDSTAPGYSLVSGSASKLSRVAPIEGTVFQESAPGYMMLVIREDGAVDVEVVGAPAEYLSCPEDAPGTGDRARCMAEAEEAFKTLFTGRLAPPVGM